MGTGHVMRCLALAQAWQDMGGTVSLLARDLPAALAARCGEEGVTVLPFDPVAPDGEQTAAAEACAAACDVPDCKAVDIDFLSPLRLQDNGRILGPDEIDEARLLNALVRRAYLLIACHADAGFKPEFTALKAGAERVVGERQLCWFQHSRQSNRNPGRSPSGGAGKADIPMSGVIGRWRLTGEIAPFLPYLALGSWTGVGKMAVCGMGMYLLSVAV